MYVYMMYDVVMMYEYIRNILGTDLYLYFIYMYFTYLQYIS